jgi:hypothetical protein
MPGISTKMVVVIKYSLFFPLLRRSYSYLDVSTRKQKPLLPTCGHVILTQALPIISSAYNYFNSTREKKEKFPYSVIPHKFDFQFSFSKLKTRMVAADSLVPCLFSDDFSKPQRIKILKGVILEEATSLENS